MCRLGNESSSARRSLSAVLQADEREVVLREVEAGKMAGVTFGAQRCSGRESKCFGEGYREHEGQRNKRLGDVGGGSAAARQAAKGGRGSEGIRFCWH